MNKRLMIVLVVVTLLLVGCGNNDNNEKKNNNDDNNASNATKFVKENNDVNDMLEEKADEVLVEKADEKTMNKAIVLTPEMIKEGEAFDLTGEEVLFVVQEMTALEAMRRGLSLEAYLEELDDSGQTAFAVLKESMNSSGINFLTMHETLAFTKQMDDTVKEAQEFKWVISDEMIEEAERIGVSPEEIMAAVRGFAEREANDSEGTVDDFVGNLAMSGYTPFSLMKMASKPLGMNVVEYYEMLMGDDAMNDMDDSDNKSDESDDDQMGTDDKAVENNDAYMAQLIELMPFEVAYMNEEMSVAEDGMAITIVEYYSDESTATIAMYYAGLLGLEMPAESKYYQLEKDYDGDLVRVEINPSNDDQYESFVFYQVDQVIANMDQDIDVEDEEKEDEKSDEMKKEDSTSNMTMGEKVSLETLQAIIPENLEDVHITGVLYSDIQETNIEYFANGDHQRIESELAFGNFTSIYDPDLDQTFTFSNISSSGLYKSGNDVAETIFGLSAFAYNITGEVDAHWMDLNGNEVMYVKANADGMTVDAWFHKEYMIPVKYIVSMGDDVFLTYEMIDMIVGKVDPDLFVVPTDIEFVPE